MSSPNVVERSEPLARASCANCRFAGPQECRRHAPASGNASHERPRQPIILEMSGYWCGDHERAPTPPKPCTCRPLECRGFKERLPDGTTCKHSEGMDG